MTDFSGIISGLIMALLKPIWNLMVLPFKYPIILEYESQDETTMGYVCVISIRSEKNKLITMPKNKLSVKIVFDRNLLKKVEKQKVIYGEHVVVFDSPTVLQAFLDNRSFANVTDYISSTNKPRQLFLLIQVKGPGSSNPSSRLQLVGAYKSVKIKLRKTLMPFTYLEIPINHITFIASNDKTRIIEK